MSQFRIEDDASHQSCASLSSNPVVSDPFPGWVVSTVMDYYFKASSSPPKWDSLIASVKSATWWPKALSPPYSMHPESVVVPLRVLLKNKAPNKVFEAILSTHPHPKALCSYTDIYGDTPLHTLLKNYSTLAPTPSFTPRSLCTLLLSYNKSALVTLNTDLQLPCNIGRFLNDDTDALIEKRAWMRNVITVAMTAERRFSEGRKRKRAGPRVRPCTNGNPEEFVCHVLNHFRDTKQETLRRKVLGYLPSPNMHVHEGACVYVNYKARGRDVTTSRLMGGGGGGGGGVCEFVKRGRGEGEER